MRIAQLSAIPADTSSGPHLGAILGLVQAGGGVGGAIGPFLGGWLFDVTGNYRMAFIAARDRRRGISRRRVGRGTTETPIKGSGDRPTIRQSRQGRLRPRGGPTFEAGTSTLEYQRLIVRMVEA